MRNSCQTSSFEDLCPKKGEIMLLYSIFGGNSGFMPWGILGKRGTTTGKAGKYSTLSIPHSHNRFRHCSVVWPDKRFPKRFQSLHPTACANLRLSAHHHSFLRYAASAPNGLRPSSSTKVSIYGQSVLLPPYCPLANKYLTRRCFSLSLL